MLFGFLKEPNEVSKIRRKNMTEKFLKKLKKVLDIAVE